MWDRGFLPAITWLNSSWEILLISRLGMQVTLTTGESISEEELEKFFKSIKLLEIVRLLLKKALLGGRHI